MVKYSLIFFLSLMSYPAALENDIELDVMTGLLDAEIERQAGMDSVKGNVIMYYIGEDVQEFSCGYLRDFDQGARLEIRGILGEILFVVTADNEQMMFYSKASKSAIVCPATRENLAVLIGLDIGGNIYQLLDWVSGVVALHTGDDGFFLSVIDLTDERCTVRWSDEAGKYLQEISFDRDNEVPIAARLFDEIGEPFADVVYSDFEEVEGVLFAKKVTVNTSEMRLEVTFNKVTLNGTVNPKAFSTEPPAGAEALSLGNVVEGTAGEETNGGE